MDIRHIIAYSLIALMIAAAAALIMRYQKVKRERRRHYR
jgi:CHASE1-domain containing sensor protein